MGIIQRLLWPRKVCLSCGEEKDLSDFPSAKMNRDGKASYCKACYAERTREWYQHNAEHHRQRSREYRAANPDSDREYRQQNKEHISARERAHAKANPGANRAKARAYYARKKGGEGTHTAAEWEAVCAYYNYRCLCCGQQKPLTADHVVPLSKGGANTIDNIQPLCKPCNSRKGDKTIDYRA